MGFEVDADNIEELLEDHSIELTKEELEHLQNEHKQKRKNFKKRIMKIS